MQQQWQKKHSVLYCMATKQVIMINLFPDHETSDYHTTARPEASLELNLG